MRSGVWLMCLCCVCFNLASWAEVFSILLQWGVCARESSTREREKLSGRCELWNSATLWQRQELHPPEPVSGCFLFWWTLCSDSDTCSGLHALSEYHLDYECCFRVKWECNTVWSCPLSSRWPLTVYEWSLRWSWAQVQQTVLWGSVRPLQACDLWSHPSGFNALWEIKLLPTGSPCTSVWRNALRRLHLFSALLSVFFSVHVS